MARQYQWRATTKFASDTSLSYGITPSTSENWQTANIGEQEPARTWTWWYRDTNTPYYGQWVDDISTRVAVRMSESWSTSVDEYNNLIVTVNVTVDSVKRDDALGGGGANLPGRSITLYQWEGGPSILGLTDVEVGEEHTLYDGPLTVRQFSFTIPPGNDTQHSTLYLHNQTIGHESYDDIWVGVQFRNILPADYRPGAVYRSGWKSTDRNTGACNQFYGGSWHTMRTINGGSGTNNPPSIYHSNNTFYNQRRVGSD